MIILLIFPLVLYYYYYINLLVDSLLGLLMASVVVYVIINNEYKKYDVCLLSILLAFLTLTKDIGAYLSLVACGIVFVNILVNNNNYKLIFKGKTKNLFVKLKPFFITTSVVLISFISWQINIKLNDANKNFGDPIIVSEVFDVIIGKDETYKTEVYNKYKLAIKTEPIYNINGTSITLLPYIILSMLILYLMSNFYKDKQKTYFASNFILYAGWALYIIIMLILYMFKFTEYEALQLASWVRYMNIYANCILALICYLAINKCTENINKVFILIFAILICLLGGYNFKNTINNNSSLINDAKIVRESYKIPEALIKDNICPKKGKVYFIIQNTTGYDFYLLRSTTKECLSGTNPYLNNQYSWSIGEKYYEGDIWTKTSMTYDSWKKELLKDYDYVLLVKVDEQFIEQFGKLFESRNIKNNQLYKVDVKKEKLILVDEA